MRIDEIINEKQTEAPILDSLSSLPPMTNAMIHIDGSGNLAETPLLAKGIDLMASETDSDARLKLGLGSASLYSSTDFASTSSLAGKANTVHSHSISDVTGLQGALDAKASSSELSSGLSGKSNVSHTHAWADITSKPTLFSGVYSDLTGKPTLFSGNYADLSGKPSLFSGSYADLTGKPTIPSIVTGAFISNAPTNAPTDAATNAATNSKTDYNVLTTLLGTLTDGLNTTNATQNSIAAIVNANAAKQNTMGGIVNTIASKLNLTFTSLKANAILASS